MNDEGIPLSEWVDPEIDRSGPKGAGEFCYIDIGSIDRSSKRVVDAATLPVAKAPSRAKQVLKADDVLVSMTRPNLNAVALVPPHLDGAIGSTGFHVLRAKHAEPRFLFYAVQTHKFIEAMSLKVQGALYPAVRPADISSFCIPPFSLARQRRIVAKIEELFSELEAGEESLRLARRQLATYRQSLLKQAFEGKLTAKWREQNPDKLESPETLLASLQLARQSYYEKELAKWERAVNSWSKNERKNKRPIRPSEPALYEPKDFDEEVTAPGCWAVEQIGNCTTDSLIGLVRSADEQTAGPIGFSYIKMDRVDMDGNVDIASEIFVACTEDEVKRFALMKGDILFNTRNSVELVGKVGIVRRDPESPTVYNNNLLRIRLPECLDSVFVGLQLCAQPFRQRMERVKKATTSVAAVYAKDFWPLPLAVCSLPEQQEIVRLLDEQFEVIERNEREIDAALRRSEALRQSILHRAFTGKLVPQDPADEPATELLARLRAGKAKATTEASGKKSRNRRLASLPKK